MLEYVNISFVIIIIIALIVNMVILYKSRFDLQKRVNALEAQLKVLSPNGGPISIVDFAELDKLTPEAKELYRKYILNNLSPKAMEAANKLLIDNKVLDDLKKQAVELEKMTSADFGKGMDSLAVLAKDVGFGGAGAAGEGEPISSNGGEPAAQPASRYKANLGTHPISDFVPVHILNILEIDPNAQPQFMQTKTSVDANGNKYTSSDIITASTYLSSDPASRSGMSMEVTGIHGWNRIEFTFVIEGITKGKPALMFDKALIKDVKQVNTGRDGYVAKLDGEIFMELPTLPPQQQKETFIDYAPVPQGFSFAR